MNNLPGVFTATKKDGSIYYRSNITINNKHISLGSFDEASLANRAYKEAFEIFNSSLTIDDYSQKRFILSFNKFVVFISQFCNIEYPFFVIAYHKVLSYGFLLYLHIQP